MNETLHPVDWQGCRVPDRVRHRGSSWLGLGVLLGWLADPGTIAIAAEGPPIITEAPTGALVTEGSALTLRVSAEGTPPTHIQWLRNGVPIEGAHETTLSLPAVGFSEAGTYTVLVTNSSGMALSVPAGVTVSRVSPPATTVLVWKDSGAGESSVPESLTNAVTVRAGWYHFVAVRHDGRLSAWGVPNHGVLEVPASATNLVSAVAGYDHTLALRRDGTLVAWGSDEHGQRVIPAGLIRVAAIAAGDYHNLALRENGTVVAWGENANGQCNVPPGLTDVVAIAASNFGSFAVRLDGRVVAWGGDSAGTLTALPPGLAGIAGLSAKHSHVLARRTDGTVVAWGLNHAGQTNVPTGLNDVDQVAAGQSHSLARRRDGTVVGWGAGATAAHEDDFGASRVPLGLTGVSSLGSGLNSGFAVMSGRPTLVQPPRDAAILEGGYAHFNTWVRGPDPVTLGWRRDGAPIPWTPVYAQQLVITNAGPTDAASRYTIEASNRLGTVSSPSVSIRFITGEPGSPDPAFAVSTRDYYSEIIQALAVQPDGRVLVGGHFIHLGGESRARIGRLLPDGRIDPGFVVGSGADGPVLALKLQPDGKVLVGGEFQRYRGQARPFLMRLNPDGSVDEGFQAGRTGPDGGVYCLHLQADGKIVVGGAFRTFHGVQRPSLARVHPDGQLEEGYPAGAFPINNPVYALAPLPDGRLYFAGDFWEVNGQARDRAARLLANGRLDGAFVPTVGFFVRCLAVQPDGQLVLGGGHHEWPHNRQFIARLRSGGQPDPGFRTDVLRRWVQSMFVATDGRIVVGFDGGTGFGYQEAAGILRLNPDGSHDSVFDPGTFEPAGAVIRAVTELPDGRILAGGGFNFAAGHLSGGVVRLHQGTLPTLVSGPISRRIVMGQPVTFGVLATNAAKLSYQWQFNGISIPGATHSSLTLDAVRIEQAGDYTVVVRNSTGSVISEPARLTPVVAPSEALALAPARVSAGSNAVLSVTVLGTPPFSYQWRLNGVPIPGANQAILEWIAARDADSGEYSVTVANEAGEVTSPPVPVQVFFGDGHVYRWLFPGVAGSHVADLTAHPSFPTYPSALEKLTNGLAGNQNRDDNFGSLVQGFLTAPESGDFTFWLAADDAAELWISTDDTPENLLLAAFCGGPVPPEDWSARPEQKSSALSLVEGRRYYFEVLHQEAAGADHLAVGWQRPGGAPPRPIPARYLSPWVEPVTAPVWRQQPESLVAIAGGPAVLNAVAEGVPPLSYQWLHEGIPVPGATSPTLSLPTVSTAHAGSYQLQATNAFGVTRSDRATLAVHYTLQTTSSDGGRVVRSPDRASYAPGTEVRLEALAEPGFVFIRWTDDATGAGTPLVLVIDRHLRVTAEFKPLRNLTVSHNPEHGEVTRIPDAAAYPDGTEVVLSAAPRSGYLFVGWRGGTNTVANPLRLNLDRDLGLEAVFERAFQVVATVDGHGTLVVEPVKSAYLAGETVTLRAIPADGSGFVAWSGSRTGNDPLLTLIIDQDLSLTAHFRSVVQVQATARGDGTVRVTPGGTTQFLGTRVTFEAVPATGWSFVEWTGALTGAANPVDLVLAGDTLVEAVFRRRFAVTTEVVGRGAVSVLPRQDSYLEGAAVTITASAPAGQRFVEWRGDLEGTANPATLVVDGDKRVIGVFAPTWTLLVTTTPGGTVIRTPESGRYLEGTPVRLEAIPSDGFEFVGWEGDLTGTANPTEILMTTNRVVQARFQTRVPVRPEIEIHTARWETDGFHLFVLGQAGSVYVVEGSLDLRVWVAIRTNTPATHRSEFVDPAGNDQESKFYRVRAGGN